MINKISKMIPFQKIFKSKMGQGAIKNGIADIFAVDDRNDLTEDEKIPMRITAVGDLVAGGVMSTANPFGLIIGGGIMLTNIGIRRAVEGGLHKRIKGTWKNSRKKAQEANSNIQKPIITNPCLTSGSMAIQMIR
jgi:hypothetical protein